MATPKKAKTGGGQPPQPGNQTPEGAGLPRATGLFNPTILNAGVPPSQAPRSPVYQTPAPTTPTYSQGDRWQTDRSLPPYTGLPAAIQNFTLSNAPRPTTPSMGPAAAPSLSTNVHYDPTALPGEPFSGGPGGQMMFSGFQSDEMGEQEWLRKGMAKVPGSNLLVPKWRPGMGGGLSTPTFPDTGGGMTVPAYTGSADGGGFGGGGGWNDWGGGGGSFVDRPPPGWYPGLTTWNFR